MNSGSEALEEGLQVILEPYLWEAVSGEEANVNWAEALYSSLMGFVSANITEGVDMAIDATAKVTNPTDTVRTQKTVTDSRNALMSPINNLDITAPEQLQSALTDQIKKAEPKMTSENMGQQSETVTAESNQTNVTVNPEAVAQSLMNKGFNPETSAEIADAVAARLNGQKLTKAQRNILSSATNIPSVQSVISDMQKMQKGSPKLLAGNIGKSTGTVQPINNQADVAQSLRNKGINSQKADSIAEAITARLNGQELTRPQRDILRSALESPTVQSVVSEFMQKKTDGVDSAQYNGYDEVNASEVNEAMVNSGSYQDQEEFFNGSYAADSEIRKFNSWDDMKDTYKGTITQFIKENKPKYSPEIKKWFDNGGSIEVRDSDGKKIWIYTSSEGVSVPYIDGYIKFPDAYLHSTIKPIDIGEFTGDRGKDVEKMLPILQADYGIDEIPDGYTVHHDIVNGILQLVDESVHTEFTHIGGYSIYK